MVVSSQTTSVPQCAFSVAPARDASPRASGEMHTIVSGRSFSVCSWLPKRRHVRSRPSMSVWAPVALLDTSPSCPRQYAREHRMTARAPRAESDVWAAAEPRLAAFGSSVSFNAAPIGEEQLEIGIGSSSTTSLSSNREALNGGRHSSINASDNGRLVELSGSDKTGVATTDGVLHRDDHAAPPLMTAVISSTRSVSGGIPSQGQHARTSGQPVDTAGSANTSTKKVAEDSRSDLQEGLDDAKKLERQTASKASALMRRMTDAGKRGRWRDVEPALSEMESQGLIKDGRPYTVAIKALGDNGQAVRALKLLEGMRDSGIAPNAFSYTAAANACAKTGDWKGALRLLREMKDRDGLEPNEFTYTAAVTACGRGGNLDGAMDLLQEMRGVGVPPNCYTYNSAIHACARKGKWQSALELVEVMKADGLTPTLATYSCAADACAKGGNCGAALKILDEVRELGLDVGEILYNTVMEACGAAGQTKMSLSLLETMRKDGVQPSPTTYTTAINACSRTADWKRALLLLVEMRKAYPSRSSASCVAQGAQLSKNGDSGDKKRGDVTTRGGVSSSSSNGPDWWGKGDVRDVTGAAATGTTMGTHLGHNTERRLVERAEAVDHPSRTHTADHMSGSNDESGGSPGDAFTAKRSGQAVPSRNGERPERHRQQKEAVALGRRREGGDMERGKGEEGGVGGTWSRAGGVAGRAAIEDGRRAAYNAAINVCGRAGRWDRALGLLEEMPSYGITPDVVSYNSAICACGYRAKWDRATGLLAAAWLAGLKPDGYTYSSAIHACAGAARWEEAMSLLREMEMVGLEPNVVAYGAAMSALANGKQWQLALALLDEVCAYPEGSEVRPNAVLYGAAIRACAGAGMWRVGIELLERMHASTGVKPSLVCFNGALHGMSCAGEGKRARQLLEAMQRGPRATRPDIYSYNSAIAACGAKGEADEARQLLEEMRQRGTTPDIYSYNGVMQANVAGGNWATALEILEETRREELIPDITSFNIAVHACAVGHQWQAAIDVLEEMSEAGLAMDAFTYAHAIEACCNAGNRPHVINVLAVGGLNLVVRAKITALSLVTELRDKGLPLRMATYTAIKDAFGDDALAQIGRTAPPPEAFMY